MLIPNIFAVAALLSALASGLPLGANKEFLSKREAYPPYGFDRVGNKMDPAYFAVVREALESSGGNLAKAKEATINWLANNASKLPKALPHSPPHSPPPPASPPPPPPPLPKQN
ncbi:hypothetical protein HYALB_00012698 [Hymenoscyphus albidus]|uniref:Uncharacterized protein n=1 Tax=Hymenoscyphus albidus TaxID=595503 RepID=A0A9N9LXE8_9HELO|nr:hypothetical protein HYALB_00012698 [Hymenoscyphus albidus]